MMHEDETTIDIDMSNYVTLKVSEVWPDGDAPENVTAADVAAVMMRDTKRRTLDDWCLLDDLDVTVTVRTPNPAYKRGVEPLPGMTVPTPYVSTRAEPWSAVSSQRSLPPTPRTAHNERAEADPTAAYEGLEDA